MEEFVMWVYGGQEKLAWGDCNVGVWGSRNVCMGRLNCIQNVWVGRCT